MTKYLILTAALGLAACQTTTGASIPLGDNASRWAYDGECDDPRFVGPGADEILMAEDAYHDAADCGRALASGTIWLR